MAENKIAIVSGPTSGIGLEIAKELADQGLDIIMASRSIQKSLACEQIIRKHADTDIKIHHIELDLASFTSIKDFARQVNARFDNIDILINNAGVFCDTRQKTKDGFEMTMGVNHIGTYMLTRLLLPTILKTPWARIVNVSSKAALYGQVNLENPFNGPHGFKAYSASKLAQIWFTISLAEELQDKDVTVNAVHPGRGATNIWNGNSLLMKMVRPIMLKASIPAKDCAQRCVYVALSPELNNVSGQLYGDHKPMEYNQRCLDKHSRTKLMLATKEVTGI